MKRTRKDKKRQVKALIPLETKEMIHRIANVTNTPIKDVCEFLTVFVMDDVQTINDLSKYFKRGVLINDTIYTGDIKVIPIDKRLKVESDLVTITFKLHDYERIAIIAYALDCSPTRTTAILLEHASSNIKAVNEYVYSNLKTELTDGQIQELRKILSYVNRFNPDKSSWLTLLSKIVGDVRPATKKLYELVNEFLRGK